MVMREPRIGEAFIVLHENSNDHDRHGPTRNGSQSWRRLERHRGALTTRDSSVGCLQRED